MIIRTRMNMITPMCMTEKRTVIPMGTPIPIRMGMNTVMRMRATTGRTIMITRIMTRRPMIMRISPGQAEIFLPKRLDTFF